MLALLVKKLVVEKEEATGHNPSWILKKREKKLVPQRQGRNQLRIIGGKWRGRKLVFPSVVGLRPTGDRIRETLFNWLAPHIVGAHCLDLFAGSGALGLEASSRGAAHVVMLDTDSQTISQLLDHCARLEAREVTVLQANALQWLNGAGDGEQFDVVFLDPPFDAPILEPLIIALNGSGRLHDETLIYLETARDQAVAVPPNWRLLRQKSAGQVSFALYQFCPE
ncbi:MAG: 16S rRNA (guanine(966)-N(2))-methyltransferase RsmD [Cellvibrionaceae bacterium]